MHGVLQKLSPLRDIDAKALKTERAALLYLGQPALGTDSVSITSGTLPAFAVGCTV
jgi:hypothetical protein